MRTNSCIFILVLIVSFATVGLSSPLAETNGISIETVNSTTDGFTLSIEFPSPTLHTTQLEEGEQLTVDMIGAVPDFASEGMSLPAITRFIAVPNGYRVEAKIIKRNETTIELEPTIARDGMVRSARHLNQQLTIDVGEPGWMRSYHIAPVVINPVTYQTDEHQLTSTQNMEIEFKFVPDNSLNRDVPDPERYWSPTFEEMLRVMLLNPQGLPVIAPGGRQVQRGTYLIITSEALAQRVDTLVEWKRRKGFAVHVESMIPTPPQNISAETVKDFIQDAYDTWDRPPEYILLIGDVNMPGIQLPAFRMTNPGHLQENDVTDWPYVLLEGEDYFPDAFIGRFSVDSPSPGGLLKVMFRSIYQDMTPSLEDLDWYHRATLFAGNYGEGGNPISSPVETCRWLGRRLTVRDWDVDELYYENDGDDRSAEPVVRSHNRDRPNRGVNISAYRGWGDANGPQYPLFQRSNLDQLENGPMLPVMTFLVCNVGDYGNDNVNPCFGEAAIQAGTINRSKGAVAFYGPSDLHTSTQYNNPNLAGYYSGLIDHGLRNISQLAFAGKMEIWRGYPNRRHIGGEGNFVEFYFHVYNILGDPDLTVYYDPPDLLDVTHPDQLAVGATHTRIVVQRENGRAVLGALVTMLKDDETEVSVLTDREGIALVPINLETTGMIQFTVIAHNGVPYLTDIPVEAADRMIGLSEVSVDYADGDMLPLGIPVNLSVTLRNSGQNAINGITTELISLSEDIEIIQPEAGFGNIAVGGTAAGDQDFRVKVSRKLSNAGSVPFQLNISDDQGTEYQALFRLETLSPMLSYVDHGFTNEVVNPGEETDVVLNITNYGSMDVSGLQATIHTFDESIEIVDADAVFGDLAMGEYGDCSNSPFSIRVQEGTYPGRQVQLRTVFTDSNGEFVDFIAFNIVIGTVGPTNPLGPDGYGYFAYENIDEQHNGDPFDQTPTYEWIELDPDYGGANGTMHEVKDDTVFYMELPFTFQYYGREYNSAIICDNGWISLGDGREYNFQKWNFRNWGLPSPLGLPALIAPFWEDLVNRNDENVAIPNKIFTSYDEENDRFIIEWSRAIARTSVNNYEETFEVILYNNGDETPTGDGELVFQYNTVSVVDQRELNYCTVGIEDHNHLTGLEVTFSNHYAASCAELEAGRAIKFTTSAPDNYEEIDYPEIQPLSFALANPFPNPFNSRTTISFTIPSTDMVNLTVWDISGRMVKRLVGSTIQAGTHSVTLDAGLLTSGLYFVRLEAGNLTTQRKLLLIK